MVEIKSKPDTIHRWEWKWKPLTVWRIRKIGNRCLWRWRPYKTIQNRIIRRLIINGPETLANNEISLGQPPQTGCILVVVYVCFCFHIKDVGSGSGFWFFFAPQNMQCEYSRSFSYVIDARAFYDNEAGKTKRYYNLVTWITDTMSAFLWIVENILPWLNTVEGI